MLPHFQMALLSSIAPRTHVRPVTVAFPILTLLLVTVFVFVAKTESGQETRPYASKKVNNLQSHLQS